MKFNKYTKLIIFIGIALIIAAITASAVTAITAGRIGNYYVFMSYSRDFATLSRQYIGLTTLGAIIAEVIYHPEKDNKTE